MQTVPLFAYENLICERVNDITNCLELKLIRKLTAGLPRARSFNTEFSREVNVLLRAQCMVNLSKNHDFFLTGVYTYTITDM